MSDLRQRDPLLPQRAAFARRTFLQISGVSAAGLLLAACGDEDNEDVVGAADEQGAEQEGGDAVVIDFAGAPDLAVVNFAYALEQLEAAFYSAARDAIPSGASKQYIALVDDLKAHEVAHREFFKAKLGDKAIPALQVDFSMVNFGDEEGFLRTALDLENTGVAAYNGAASLIGEGGPLGIAPLLAAGDIVSVEARHASAIATVLGPDTGDEFAPQAFDDAKPPEEILQAVDPFISTNIELRNVPASNQSTPDSPTQ